MLPNIDQMVVYHIYRDIVYADIGSMLDHRLIVDQTLIQ